MLDQTLLIGLVLFFAALIRSTVGFGDALIAMPLLSLLVGLRVATPLAQLMSSVIAISILVSDWQRIALRDTWRLILATLIGIPVGLLVLTRVPEKPVTVALGVVLILFGGYNLVRPPLPELGSHRWAYLFGLVAGVLGGAYNTNGPPIVLYGTLRRWSAERFRATLQSYFFPTGLMILAGHAAAGLWTIEVGRSFALALPGILLGVFVGGRLNRYIGRHQFERWIYLALVGFGLLLFISALR